MHEEEKTAKVPTATVTDDRSGMFGPWQLDLQQAETQIWHFSAGNLGSVLGCTNLLPGSRRDRDMVWAREVHRPRGYHVHAKQFRKERQ